MIAVGNSARIDNTATYGGHHIAAGDQRTHHFKYGGNENGATHGDGTRADRRTDVVGDIVGADVHGHVTADHGSHHQHGALRTDAAIDERGVDHDADDEKQANAQSA